MSLTKSELKTLREIRDLLEMERANFDDFSRTETEIPAGGVTAFIRQRTRLWRETWVLAPLDDLLAKHEVAK